MKPSHQIEKIRDQELDDILEEFFDEDNHYTKNMLEKLVSKYRKAILPYTKSLHDEVTTFFDVVKELQQKHESMVKTLKRNAKRYSWNDVGRVFREGFLEGDVSLLATYQKYFQALNKLMPPLKKKIGSSGELFRALLVLNSQQRDDETWLSLMYKPMTRLLSVIHQLEELIFLLSSMRPLEAEKLVKTRNALLACFLKGPRMPTRTVTPLSSPSTSTSPSTSSRSSTKSTPPSKSILGKRKPPQNATKTPPQTKVVPPKVSRITIHHAQDQKKKPVTSTKSKSTNLTVPSRRMDKK